jgi:hypothetical protein
MIQWYLARPCIISGQDARTTRNFGIFFKLEVSYQLPIPITFRDAPHCTISIEP